MLGVHPLEGRRAAGCVVIEPLAGRDQSRVGPGGHPELGFQVHGLRIPAIERVARVVVGDEPVYLQPGARRARGDLVPVGVRPGVVEELLEELRGVVAELPAAVAVEVEARARAEQRLGAQGSAGALAVGLVDGPCELGSILCVFCRARGEVRLAGVELGLRAVEVVAVPVLGLHAHLVADLVPFDAPGVGRLSPTLRALRVGRVVVVVVEIDRVLLGRPIRVLGGAEPVAAEIHDPCKLGIHGLALFERVLRVVIRVGARPPEALVEEEARPTCAHGTEPERSVGGLVAEAVAHLALVLGVLAATPGGVECLHGVQHGRAVALFRHAAAVAIIPAVAVGRAVDVIPVRADQHRARVPLLGGIDRECQGCHMPASLYE
ncbi:hypothetical protein D3C72_1337360 [compost metagenome]